jgi:hypothetical protein
MTGSSASFSASRQQFNHFDRRIVQRPDLSSRWRWGIAVPIFRLSRDRTLGVGA